MIRISGALFRTCAAFIAVISLVSCAQGVDSHRCDERLGPRFLAIGGLTHQDLDVEMACEVHQSGFRGGARYTVLMTGGKDEVERTLRQGGLDPTDGSVDRAHAVRTQPRLDVRVTPVGEEWRPGDRLTLGDSYVHNGEAWLRYVAWGRQTDQEDYALVMMIERGF